MIDDHDRSEWVNVSSVPGSPGLSLTKSSPGQSPESRKIVVVVVVVVGLFFMFLLILVAVS